MFYDSHFANEVTDFSTLPTGHKKWKVVVTDEHRWILFTARILQNRFRTTGKLLFDNRKVLDLRSGTVRSQKVRLFWWNEELERRWRWQCEIGKIEGRLETARAEDVIVLEQIVAEEAGRPVMWQHPLLAASAKVYIVKLLREDLNIVQLQRIAGMLNPMQDLRPASYDVTDLVQRSRVHHGTLTGGCQPG